MQSLIELKKTTLLLLFLVAFASSAVSPMALAISPAPDGCYSNFTTAEGCDALNMLTTGAGNTGLGWRSLFLNSTGSFNTGVGGGALALNNGDSNTAVGAGALLLNSGGTENTAIGTDALVYNDVGNYNTAVGFFALFNDVDGSDNNAFGNGALLGNMHAHDNTAIGDLALTSNDITGANLAVNNTAVGAQALFSNTDGAANVAVGNGAGFNITTGNGNVVVGFLTGFGITTGDSIIAIGPVNGASTVFGQVPDSCYIGNIYGQPVDDGSAIPVYVDADGKLGTAPMNANGNKMTVPDPVKPRAMLNELLKQQKRIAELEGTVACLAAIVKEQAAQMQKVSDHLAAASPFDGRLEVSKIRHRTNPPGGPAPQTAATNQ